MIMKLALNMTLRRNSTEANALRFKKTVAYIFITLAHTSQREIVIYNGPTVKQTTSENPEMVDIAMVYATTSFYSAANEVSPFTQLFEDAMSTGIDSNEDFSIIMTKVKSQLQAKSYTCTMEFITGLTNQCYFLW